MKAFPKAALAAVAMTALAGCTSGGIGMTWQVDHDSDPSTPDVVVTKEQRCAARQTAIALLEDLPEPRAEEVERAITVAYGFAAIAGCAFVTDADMPEEVPAE